MTNSFVRTLKHRLAGLGLAAALSLGLMVASFLRIAGDATSAAFNSVVHDSVVAGPIWGTALARNLFVFLIALSVLHLGFGVLCWLLARLSLSALPNVKATRTHWLLVWFCVFGACILVANAALFPESSLGEPYAQAVRAEVLGISAFTLVTWLAGAAVVAVVAAVVALASRRLRAGEFSRTQGAIAVIAVAGVVAALAVPASQGSKTPLAKPHVIVIGIDSLRYDAVGSDTGPASAPNVRRFLAEAASFSDATTPLARTFPSWVSILTGRHPHTTGAMINLLPRDLIKTGSTLGDLFRRAGYRTVYSIDEVRFSNVDATYGFDQTITPPIGASDFLIGWFGDTPLSNLVVNSRLGAVLFPHLYANRGAAKIYDPDEFVVRLGRELNFEQPTFLALHLTLAHWPFSWANSPTSGEPKTDYPLSVTRVDEQFRDVMAMLERRGALANALVFVISDHGEAVGVLGDTLVQDSSLGVLYEKHKHPLGHGTDVLSPQQYRVVLGVRPFGACPIRIATGTVTDAPVSLEDLAPTLADFFSLEAREKFDGRSLRALLQGEPGAADALRDRVRFTESEFNPTGVMTSGKLSTSAAAAAALFYRVDPATDRIEIRRDRIAEILDQREFAAFRSADLLAALPHPSGAGYQLVAARRDGTEARELTAAPGPNAYPELESLWVALEGRFSLGRRASPNGSAQ